MALEQRYLNRRRARITLAMMYFGIASVILGSLLANTYLYGVGVGVLLVAVIRRFRGNKCPYCGAKYAGLHWKQEDEGYCPGCSRLLEYDN
ncbi:MAG: hypothetical protein IJO95_04175 [Clostridia bacterium]|nr:hypothetical protein [Clostridia bacterium]